MEDWKKIVLSSSESILNAIEIIDRGALQIALVVDDNYRLLGTITDGDVRRGILKGFNLNESVRLVLNENPTVVLKEHNRAKALSIMRNKKLRQIPIIDENQILVGMESMDDLLQPAHKDNRVVIMAGGTGNRLMPLTATCPKPLLNVGGKPVLETILESFVEQGFRKFYISVNYKAEMIENYFGGGSQWGIEIEYLREKTRLGTVGALGLIPEKMDKAILVINGDILTKVDFRSLLNFHMEHGSEATMCVRQYHLQVPFGVVSIDKHRLNSIEEKPVHRFFVNAGLYVLNPGALAHIPGDTYYDMPDLFKNLIKMGKETSVFPIREYWMDIGHMDDYEKANGEFQEVFG